MNMLRVAQLILVVCLVQQARSCLKKRGQAGPLQPAAQGVIPRMVGDGVETSPYDSSGDSPVTSGDELSCDFSDGCCWTNAVPPADELNWVKGSGTVDPAKMQASFGTSNAPDGDFLITASESAGTASQQAVLYSCPIECAEGDVTVKVTHWQSDGVSMHVCTTHDPEDNPSDGECQDLPGESGNDDSVTLTGEANMRIAIVAKGFQTATGSVAMIDDISVEFSPCQSTTQPTQGTDAPTEAPPPAAVAPCQEIVCNFEQGNPCAYQPASSGGNANQNWAVQSAPYQNLLTGVPKPGEGSKFAATYLKKSGEKSTMTTNGHFDSEYVVRFNAYKATEGINLKACCNTEDNCPYGASPSVQTSDYRTWKSASIKCPADTDKVHFVCENTGNNEGACGVDDIKLLQSGGGGPDDASQSACP